MLAVFLIFLTFTLKIRPATTDGELLQLSIEAKSDANFSLGTPFTVTCSLDGNVNIAGSMLFFCPYSPNTDQFCLQNCINICEGDESCLNKQKLNEISCSKSVDVAHNKIIYQYSIPKIDYKWNTSKFYCKHQNTISENLQIPNLVLKSSTTERKASEAPSTVSRKEGEQKTKEILPKLTLVQNKSDFSLPDVEQVEDQLPVEGFPKINEASMNKKRNMFKLPTEIIVVIFISLLCLSIILNLFCCLRCVLIRHYSKNFSTALMQDLFCMRKEIFQARHFRKTTNGLVDNFMAKHYPLISLTENKPNNNSIIYTCQKDLARVPEYGLGQLSYYQAEPTHCYSPRSENSSNVSTACQRYTTEGYQSSNNQKLSDSGISMNHQNNLQLVQEMPFCDKPQVYDVTRNESNSNIEEGKLYLIQTKLENVRDHRKSLLRDDVMTIQSEPMSKSTHIHQFPASVEYSGVKNVSDMSNAPVLYIQNEDISSRMRNSTILYEEASLRRNKSSTNSFQGNEIHSDTIERKMFVNNGKLCHTVSNPFDVGCQLSRGQKYNSSILYYYPSQIETPLMK